MLDLTETLRDQTTEKSNLTAREQTTCNVFETRNDIAERVHIDMLKI